MDFIIGIIAHLAGLSDDQLKQLEAALPATKRLIDVVIKAQPLIDEAQPLIAAALVEWKTVGPVVESVLAALIAHVSAGNTWHDAILDLKLKLGPA